VIELYHYLRVLVDYAVQLDLCEDEDGVVFGALVAHLADRKHWGTNDLYKHSS
jgi:hypothetical protein